MFKGCCPGLYCAKPALSLQGRCTPKYGSAATMPIAVAPTMPMGGMAVAPTIPMGGMAVAPTVPMGGMAVAPTVPMGGMAVAPTVPMVAPTVPMGGVAVVPTVPVGGMGMGAMGCLPKKGFCVNNAQCCSRYCKLYKNQCD
ncbi:hypothetical protein Ciccas_013154 [Cichlidogyrus casuarinus]|uniref:Uncharacterized protein n=1 Tax=Cichlidogyrus casuarinus TaxID=1844966 RepID=A0ABD2PRE3_9PLAT